MKRILLFLALTACITAVCSSEANAGPFRRRAREHRMRVYAKATVPLAHVHSRDRFYYDIYPRYYGAIHAREIQKLGYPTGDIRLRDQPW